MFERVWKRARVVEWAGLENRYPGNGIGGSNPPASAMIRKDSRCAVRTKHWQNPPRGFERRSDFFIRKNREAVPRQNFATAKF